MRRVRFVEKKIMSQPVKHPKIDPEIKSLLRPLRESEYLALEENIQQHGCNDAVILWKEKNVILDGHNRVEICRRLKKPYRTKSKAFKDKHAAQVFVLAHQAARRNLSGDEISIIRGHRYEVEKLTEGRPRGNGKLAQNEQVSTAEKLAEEYGVSRETIKRDAEFAKGIHVISLASDDETAEAVVQRDLRIPKGVIREIGKEKDKNKAAKKAKKIVTDAQKGIKTIVQRPSESSGDRWLKWLSDWYTRMLSFREFGGFKKASRTWSQDQRDGAKEELQKIQKEIERWITLLD